MWQDQVKDLYFKEHLKITDIANKLGITRKTISTYLSGCPGFKEEKERRKIENKAKRPEYKKNWDKENRGLVEAARLKRQHEIDVAVLSSEKYY